MRHFQPSLGVWTFFVHFGQSQVTHTETRARTLQPCSRSQHPPWCTLPLNISNARSVPVIYGFCQQAYLPTSGDGPLPKAGTSPRGRFWLSSPTNSHLEMAIFRPRHLGSFWGPKRVQAHIVWPPCLAGRPCPPFPRCQATTCTTGKHFMHHGFWRTGQCGVRSRISEKCVRRTRIFPRQYSSASTSALVKRTWAPR